MIGALLIVFFLAVVFLTRPNKKRDRYFLELWRVFKKSLRKRFAKKRTPISTPRSLSVRRKSKTTITVDGKPYLSSTFAPITPTPNVPEMTNETEKIAVPVSPISFQAGSMIESSNPPPSPDPLAQTFPSKMETETTNSPKAHIEQSTVLNSASQIMEDQPIDHQISLEALQITGSYPESELNGHKAVLDQQPIGENDLNLEGINLSEDTNLDDSIIDIDQTYLFVDYEPIEIQETEHVPEWPHTYIYSYTDLDRATTEQVKFYHRLKEKFLQGSWIDIGANSNYAFILMFNLLREFNTHQDIKLLEEQFDRLGSHFPKTTSYAKRFLIQKMREIGDTNGLNRLEWSIANNYSYYEPWDWKDRYIKKLSLSKADVKLLEDVYPPSTNFMSVEQCGDEVIKLYIKLKKALLKAYQKNNIDQTAQFAKVLDILARKQYNFRNGSQNYQYVMAHSTDTLWGFVMKFCEGKIRFHYAYTKTFTFLQNYHIELINSFQENILFFVQDKIDEMMEAVASPSQELEIELNSVSTTRWKLGFDLTETYYRHHGKEAFITRAEQILSQNLKNRSLEIIHLEIAKNLMLCDKQLSFEHFLKYVGKNLQGSRLVLKTMSQKMVKKLFSTPEQQTIYFTLMTAMVKREVSLEVALAQIKDFYLPKRKKIQLDNNAIRSVEVQHSGTVELLNEYLNEEETPEEKPLDPATAQQPHTVSMPGAEQETQSFNFSTNGTESALIFFFKQNGLALTSEQLAEFCKAHGAMAGPLVNNLNETCYELIDDLLIEQDQETYSINPTYYAQILSP